MTQLEELKKRLGDEQDTDMNMRMFQTAIDADMRMLKKTFYNVFQKPWPEVKLEDKQ
jgi:hypothetical protein